MSVPFSELTQNLKLHPDDEIIFLYGFLGEFRRTSKDSQWFIADFKNFTPDIGPKTKEFPLGAITAHELGKGGYAAAILVRL